MSGYLSAQLSNASLRYDRMFAQGVSCVLRYVVDSSTKEFHNLGKVLPRPVWLMHTYTPNASEAEAGGSSLRAVWAV